MKLRYIKINLLLLLLLYLIRYHHTERIARQDLGNVGDAPMRAGSGDQGHSRKNRNSGSMNTFFRKKIRSI